jgi:hypothetical protein
MKVPKVLLLILIQIFLLPNLTGNAQNETTCGTILEGAFIRDIEDHDYRIQLYAGDNVVVSAEALGDFLKMRIVLYRPATRITPAEIILHSPDKWMQAENKPVLDSGIVSETGVYVVQVSNYFGTTWAGDPNPQGRGAYTLYIGCTLRDGTIIEPGDAEPVRVDSQSELPGNSSNLAPTTLEGSVVIPLISGLAMSGAIGTEGIPPYTYTLNAIGGNTLTLQVDHISGNLNLGIVVVSPDNQILFYGGLIASNTLSTTLTLPIDSQPAERQYTIGVFRVDLLPPAVPEATAFQVLGTLNP